MTVANQLAGYASSLPNFRNRIINGDMRIDQRNAGGSISTATPDDKYSVDRWIIQNRASVGVVSAQQVSDAPSGFTNSVKLTVNTIDSSLTGTETFIFDQRIEGYNISDFNWHTPANAKTITLSFWVKSSITGQHGGAIVSQAQSTASYPFSYTINSANTWEYKTITILGPPFGTWNTDNNVGLRLRFGLGTNSTYQNTAGTWVAARSDQSTGSINVLATLNATWQITGVQLEEGTVATPFEHRPIGLELSLCQRYYQKSYDLSEKPGGSVTYPTTGSYLGTYNGAVFVYSLYNTTYNQRLRSNIPLKTRMRSATGQTIKIYNPYNGDLNKVMQSGGGSSYSTSISYYSETSPSFSAAVTGNSLGNSVGDIYRYHWVVENEL